MISKICKFKLQTLYINRFRFGNSLFLHKWLMRIGAWTTDKFGIHMDISLIIICNPVTFPYQPGYYLSTYSTQFSRDEKKVLK